MGWWMLLAGILARWLNVFSSVNCKSVLSPLPGYKGGGSLFFLQFLQGCCKTPPGISSKTAFRRGTLYFYMYTRGLRRRPFIPKGNRVFLYVYKEASPAAAAGRRLA